MPLSRPSPPSLSPDPWPSSHLFGEDQRAPCSQRRAGRSQSQADPRATRRVGRAPLGVESPGLVVLHRPPGPISCSLCPPPWASRGQKPMVTTSWAPSFPSRTVTGDRALCAADPGVVARLQHSRARSGSSSLACLRQCPCLPGLPAAGTRGLDAHWLPELTSVSMSSPVIKLGGQAPVSQTLLQRLTDEPLELEWVRPTSY